VPRLGRRARGAVLGPCAHVHARLRGGRRRRADRRPRPHAERGRRRPGPAPAHGRRLGGRGLRRGSRPELPGGAHPPQAREHVLMRLAARVEHAFSPGGALERHWPEWEERPGQRAFAIEVAGTIERGGVLLAEAPTGVGKSLAYLLPAALHVIENGARVVVATATRSLQDQLVERDLPALEKATGLRIPHARLKGKANYVCPRALLTAVAHGAEERALLDELRAWAASDPRGDLDTFPASDAEAFRRVRSRVAADPLACAGPTCRRGGDCFWVRARRAA